MVAVEGNVIADEAQFGVPTPLIKSLYFATHLAQSVRKETSLHKPEQVSIAGAIRQRTGRQALTFSGLPPASSNTLWKAGDVVYRRSGAQLGPTGSKYLLVGWTRLTDTAHSAGGKLGVDWCENRILTGS